jgi:hypothetical protein
VILKLDEQATHEVATFGYRRCGTETRILGDAAVAPDDGGVGAAG